MENLVIVGRDILPVLPSVCFPSVVIRLVSQPPDVVPGLQLPHITPALVVLQPGVKQRLVHRVSLTQLHLQARVSQLYLYTVDSVQCTLPAEG